ncbi:MAG: type II toxin-antitoxin system VapC family toxin [Candidatus Aenigmarchaeota archaeon]|nr:type II toxin-antitoxin system VapC family toxin [Candidatus Aenigmarchaeota archaeon]MDI6722382.1 type II toxin-antitoxin system VapC family toxin [Candidatus Aenigmarchaeota archaeon]
MFIDANIFLELALEDKRSGECEEFFSRLWKKLIEGMTSDFVIYTCLIQIENKSNIKDMKNFLIFADNMEGLTIHSPTYQTVYAAFDIMENHKLDFDDALVVAVMRALSIKELVSFDSHFDRIREIKRIEPKDIV